MERDFYFRQLWDRIGTYLGASDTFDRNLASFARVYADQNERDYAAFKDAVNDGRLEARTGL